jgi:8-oxo-dGTP pyrophosphatase MutT (NUDIX family)
VQWKVHGRRPVYESDWVSVWLDDVDVPGVGRLEHHVLTMPRPSVTAVVVDAQDRTLLLWRHRFITNSWGWEVPAGWAEPGEDLEKAIHREIVEETGWQAGQVSPMISYNAISGISDMRFTAFVATNPARIGEPTDASESTRVEWMPLADVPRLAQDGKLSDGPSLLALSYYLGMHRAR